MEPLVAEEASQFSFWTPVTFVSQFLATYGWYLVGAAGLGLYLLHRLRPRLAAWRQAREDAEYHKDPDKALARMEAIQRAREKQQKLLLEASERALEQQRESATAESSAAHTADHNYHNGHAARHNGNESGAGAGGSGPVSISSRGRVRKLTAKARGLLRD